MTDENSTITFEIGDLIERRNAFGPVCRLLILSPPLNSSSENQAYKDYLVLWVQVYTPNNQNLIGRKSKIRFLRGYGNISGLLLNTIVITSAG